MTVSIGAVMVAALNVFSYRTGDVALFACTWVGGLVLVGSTVASRLAELHARKARAEAEAALRGAERRYQSLVNATSDLVWTASPEGALRDVPAWAAFTGQGEAQVQGWGWLQAVHPAERSQVVETFRSALAGKAPFRFEHRMQRYDGEYLHFAVCAVPVLDDGGGVREWVGLHKDITATKQLEHERTRLNMVATQSADLVAIAGLDGGLTFLNDAGREMIGLPADQPLTWSIFELLMPNDSPLSREAVLRAVLKANHCRGEVCLTNWRTGRNIDLDYNIFLVRDPVSLAPIGVSAIGRDTTERKQAEQEREQLISALARSNAELDGFASVASHDLKAPLRGISNLSTWIEEDLGGQMSDEVRQHMKLLRGRVHRLEGLIDGILTYSRAGRFNSEKAQAVDVEKLLLSIIELLAPQGEVTFAFVTPMPTLVTEVVPLQQVLMNLLANALKYGARPGARIELGARPVGSMWEFFVKDNGPGIEPQYHEKVWEIFQTLTPRDKVEGTGIGLSVVRKVAEAKGGRAWVESVPGEGATFRFTWPSAEGMRA